MNQSHMTPCYRCLTPHSDTTWLCAACRAADETPMCAWFAGCTNDAAGTVSHPVLGDVPTCARCAGMLGLDLVIR